MAYIGREPQIGNYQICDAISVVNGQAAYTMQVSSANVIPESVNHMIVSLNGVIQKPGSSYTIASSTITFSSNLATGDSIDFIYLLGNVLDLGAPSDSTVTTSKLSGNLVTPGTLDVNGQELILDADADTSITADTDDQIDIKVAGADDFQITANTLTALSGSTIKADTVAETTSANGVAVDGLTIKDGKLNTDDSVVTANITDANVTSAKIAGDAITGAKIADDAINSEHYTDGSIDTAHIADSNVTQAKIADQAINEAKMQISNAPTNGYFLSAQSGNTGGLTWAEAGGGVSDGFQAITSGSGTSSASGVIVVNDELFDDGSNYSTSNGRYTAPSTGHYLFHAGALQSGSSGTYFYFYKNGSAVGSQSRWGYNGAGNQTAMNIFMIIDLSAGDYINIYSSANVYVNQYLNFGGCKLY